MTAPIVAIDGPAGAGKSTVARQLARRLGFAIIDTGVEVINNKPTALGSTEFFDQDPAVIVQLHSSNPVSCWSTTFDAASTKDNSSQQFKARVP